MQDDEFETLELESPDPDHGVIVTQIGKAKSRNYKWKVPEDRMHTIEIHNSYVRQRRACPYCTKGSRPVQLKEFEEYLSKLKDKLK